MEKCEHEYGEWVKCYGIPSGYENTIYTDDIKVVGPQVFARRVCTKCNEPQILVGSKVLDYLDVKQQDNSKKL